MDTRCLLQRGFYSIWKCLFSPKVSVPGEKQWIVYMKNAKDAVTYMEWYDTAVGTLCSSHYNNLNSKMHFLFVMSAVRSLLLCCEQISVWLSRFRGQTPAICHIWQPSRYSPEGTINSLLNLMEVFSLCTVHICFIKERLHIRHPGKHPPASHLIVTPPNIQRPFHLVSALNFPYRQ